MKIMKENELTIQHVWQLLQPSRTYDTRGRYEKCQADWASMDEAQQRCVYQLLQAWKAKGELNPNPCYALNDAMQEYEQQQAKLRRQPPQFLRGDEGGYIVQVRYGEAFKLCRKETAEQYHLTITKDPW